MNDSNVQLWRYVVPSHNYDGWGIFLLDSKGYLSCISDYGNYSYLWTHFGPGDFRAFLCGLDSDYLLRKIAPQKVVDWALTAANLKDAILQLRRDGTLSKATARAEWELVDDARSECGYGRDSEIVGYWHSETALRDPSEWVSYSFKTQAVLFYEKVWSRFVELLKADLGQSKSV